MHEYNTRSLLSPAVYNINFKQDHRLITCAVLQAVLGRHEKLFIGETVSIGTLSEQLYTATCTHSKDNRGRRHSRSTCTGGRRQAGKGGGMPARRCQT